MGERASGPSDRVPSPRLAPSRRFFGPRSANRVSPTAPPLLSPDDEEGRPSGLLDDGSHHPRREGRARNEGAKRSGRGGGDDARGGRCRDPDGRLKDDVPRCDGKRRMFLFHSVSSSSSLSLSLRFLSHAPRYTSSSRPGTDVPVRGGGGTTRMGSVDTTSSLEGSEIVR